MNGIHSFVPTFLINFHTVENVSDFEALISRLNLIKPRMIDALEIARESSNRGVISPYFAMDGVADQSRKIIILCWSNAPTYLTFTIDRSEHLFLKFKITIRWP